MKSVQIGEATLYLGDSRDILPTLEGIDATVTDPPYGLSFMGKRWDYDVPDEEIWAACLAAMKPGAHLLAFAGTRTQHRMAVRIEDAGFEIRDMIAWVYGSGFPKSLDVSKAIDKMDASQEQQARRLKFTAWVRSQGVSASQIDEATGTNMGGHYTTAASQPAIMTREHLEDCRHLFADVPQWVERECDIRSVESRNFAAREVVGIRKQRANKPGSGSAPMNASVGDVESITAPATDAAREWQGWGTALKPALEPITVARKPLSGTVAANVQEHGTGALNIDGCRVETSDHVENHGRKPTTNGYDPRMSGAQQQGQTEGQKLGRWPANFIHDGSDDVVALFPDTRNGGGNGASTKGSGMFMAGSVDAGATRFAADSGSAARFFYCAKASKKDRDAGCDGFADRPAFDNPNGNMGGNMGSRSGPRKNNHPTVKPTDLMRYLCRLVTPPGGVVLDPFMGSGSTGKAAMLEGFRFIGIERDPHYFEIACRRIEDIQRQRMIA